MTNELAVRTEQTSNMDEIARTAKMLAMSGYFDGKGDINTQIAQIGTRILAGQEMGFGPFASNAGIHIIQGKPTVGANLMAAAVKAHPAYDYRVRHMGADYVTIEFFQNGESLGISEFTAADAKAASTQNMGKFARNMLFARAMSNGVRWYCPDVFFGNAVYTPDELDNTFVVVEDGKGNYESDDDYDDDDGDHIEDGPTDANEPFDKEQAFAAILNEINVEHAPEDTAAHVATPQPKAKGKPPTFKNVQDAITWGHTFGAYDSQDESSDAYAALKAELNPGSAGEMWAAWITQCTERVERLAA